MFRTRTRRAVASQPDGPVDSGLYVFDAKQMVWATPSSLLAGGNTNNAGGGGGTTVPTPSTVVMEGSEDGGNKTGVIAAAVVASVAVAVLMAGVLWVYMRSRARKKSPYTPLENEKTASRPPKTVAVTHTHSIRRRTVDRSQTKKYKLPPTSAAPPLPGTGSYHPDHERFIDPTRNVVIPLLAPVPYDGGGSLGRGPWDEHAASSDVGSQVSDIHVIQREVGDLSRVALEMSSQGGAGLDGAALPVRKESSVRRSFHDDIVPPPLPQSHHQYESVAAAVGAAVSTAVAEAVTVQPSTSSFSSGGSNEGTRYVVVYPHFPRMSDEIELSAGDIITVRKIYKDGWCRGTNLNTNKSGAFPLFAVEDQALDGNDVNVSYAPSPDFEIHPQRTMSDAGVAAAVAEFGASGAGGPGLPRSGG
ncbi:hypothetical protein HK104_007504, partial [Borealophlyctis nickersoniae]